MCNITHLFFDEGIFIVGFLRSGAEQKCNARKPRAAAGGRSGEDSCPHTIWATVKTTSTIALAHGTYAQRHCFCWSKKRDLIIPRKIISNAYFFHYFH